MPRPCTTVVLDEQQRLSGVLTWWDLRLTVRREEELAQLVVAQELKSPQVVTVTPDDNLETAFNMMGKNDFSFLPVVPADGHQHVVGLLRQDDLLHAYNQRVLKNRIVK
jgi:chloride channel protein, CIC family